MSFRVGPVAVTLATLIGLNALLLRADDAEQANETTSESDGRWSEQEPLVLESIVRGATNETETPGEAKSPVNAALQKGPAAEWIWGKPNAGSDDKFVFRKEFPGGSKSAALIASCDNVMTIFLNGKRIASSSSWQSPVTMDVQKFLQEGANVLTVEAANQGGPAGLALKLVLENPDGEHSYVVTNKEWEAAPSKDSDEWVAAHSLGKMGVQPWGNVFSGTPSGSNLPEIPRNVFNVLPGFQVELLYTVPKEAQGSWVSLTKDHQGRLIASDQGGAGLYRITPSPIGSDEPTKVEKLDVAITAAQGMVYAFDALYVSVNGGPGSGLYRVRDTNGDDQFDEVERLKSFQGGGEHGPHAVLLSPDGESLYVVAGNHTRPPQDFDASRIPSNWDEDLLLPRQWDARGHARGVLAPGGWIAKTDPDGKTWEVVSIGYRNTYDIAFNADGELFAYDSDMEWDMGTPWYRPTRLYHATSGSEFGWRSGTGKWPAYFVDVLPPVLDIGPGSPTGVTFGTGAKFPAKYQKALYLLDWTFGTMYAVHLESDGATYRGVKEEFLSRTPLPLTDAVIGDDGALYFAIGGRGTDSELFRVTYVGDESTEPADAKDAEFADLRALRQKIESYHQSDDQGSNIVDFLWKHLTHPDRHIRYAARVALEHRNLADWQERIADEQNPQALIQASVALARQGDPELQPQILKALSRIDFAALSESQQLDLLRAYALIFIRLGEPDRDSATELARRLDPFYPAETDPLNRELSRLLVSLNSPTVIDKTLALMQQEYEQSQAEIDELLARNAGYGGTIAQMLANQPELQKIHYAFVLRNLRYGWTLEQRQAYFAWLDGALQRSGGASYEGFIQNIRKEAIDNMSPAEQEALEAITSGPPPAVKIELPKPEGPGRNWTMEDLLTLTQNGLSGRNFENGKRSYAAARCIVCHRFDGSGGATGPDLTNAAGRFSFRDLAESIIDPSKVISDQYRAHIIVTESGQVINGRVASEQDEKLTVIVDPEDASKTVEVAKSEIESIMPSKVSLMPKDLINTLNEQEVLDLLAYLMSRGNPQDRMFDQPEE